MNRAQEPFRTRRGFSLLEVIIATAILVASTMILLQLLSIGSKHQLRAERLAGAQIVCQSLVDQWLIEPELRHEAKKEPVPGEPNWLYDANIQPAEFPGLVRIRVAVFPAADDFANGLANESTPRSTFELVRWMRSPVTAVVDQ